MHTHTCAAVHCIPVITLLQVLRGADKNINVHIKTEKGSSVQQFLWTNFGNLDSILNETGLIFTTSYGCALQVICYSSTQRVP